MRAYLLALLLLLSCRRETECRNWIDDDEDGWTDLADWDCDEGRHCNDGRDNDEDGLLDTDDEEDCPQPDPSTDDAGDDTDTTTGCRSDCCKVCTDSQACGDSCISRSSECHTYGGCACDAGEACR
jgi:hypothetical protein